MREIASTVFERMDDGKYKAVKSRHGDIVVGGIYGRLFVDVYAANNENVYIEGVR